MGIDPNTSDLLQLRRDPSPNANPALVITENWLMTMFGLRDTTLDALAADVSINPSEAAPRPDLLTFRLRYLRRQWEDADNAAPEKRPLGEQPIIDPDLIRRADLKDSVPSAIPRAQRPKTEWKALDFLEEREYWMLTQMLAIRQTREDPQSGFDALITDEAIVGGQLRRLNIGLGIPVQRFVKLRDLRREGEDIGADLNAIRLSLAAFDFLAAIYEVARQNANNVLQAEWDDVYSIFAQRLKQEAFSVWRQEEQAVRVDASRTGITLSPDHFQWQPSVMSGGTEIRLNSWRASAAVRQLWEDILRARTQQEEAVYTGLQTAVNAVEEALLGEIRNELLRLAVVPGLLTAEKLDALSQYFQIDFQAGACQMTTRIAHAIETIQGVVFGARNDLLEDNLAVPWKFYPNWRTSWTHIVPLNLASGERLVLLYDHASGVGQVYQDIHVAATLLREYQPFPFSATHIVPIGASPAGDLVLFYDSETGQGEFAGVDGQGNFSPLAAYSNWTSTWTHLLRVGMRGGFLLLCYNSSTGQVEVDQITGRGNVVQLQTFNRGSWSDVLALGTGRAGSNVLFYDRTTGAASIFAIDGQGNGQEMLLYSDWQTSWTHIIPGTFGGDGSIDLFFYEAASGTYEIYTVDDQGNIRLLRSDTRAPRNASEVVPIRFGAQDYVLLLFYRAPQATASLYAVPGLTLADPDFEEAWPWIGSYASWRAAMQVLLYPENLLRPTLRRRQSPAFETLVEHLRDLGQVDPQSVGVEVAQYAAYFEDMRSLTLRACAAGSSCLPNDPRNRDFTYLIGQGGFTKDYYWSYLDPAPADAVDSQSFWMRIPLNEEPERAFGAVCYEPAQGERFLYVFFQVKESGQDKLMFTRRNLATMTAWEPLQPLDLPRNATTFHSATVRSTGKTIQPELAIWLTEREGYRRSLNPAGKGWETAGPIAIALEGVWRHLGTQAFRNASDFACTNSISGARLALTGDFDRDGLDEIVIAPLEKGTEGNDLWVMEFYSDSWTWRHFSPTGYASEADLDSSAAPFAPLFAVTGDFDNDGQDEIAIAIDLYNKTDPLSAYEQGRRDALASRSCFWVKKYVRGTGWIDLSNDIPLPLAGYRTDNYGIAFRCEFLPFAVGRFLPTLAKSAVVGDFNNDGRDEIAVLRDLPGKAGNTLWVMQLDEGGHWRNLRDMVCGPNEDIAASFAVAGHFTSLDGPVEVAVAKKLGGAADTTTANDFWVMRMNDDGTWTSLPGIDCDGKQIPARFAVVGDFDGDKYDEIAVALDVNPSPTTEPTPANRGNDFWVMKYNLEKARWDHFSADLSFGDEPLASQFAVAGDFDGDGKDELAITLEYFLFTSAPDQPPKQFCIADWFSGTWRVNRYNLADRDINAFGALGVAGKFLNKDSPYEHLAIAGTSEIAILRFPDDYFWAYEFSVNFQAGWSQPCSVDYIKPVYEGPVQIQPRQPGDDPERLKQRSVQAFTANLMNRSANRAYIDEAFYFVPLEVALRLRESGHYTEALDWLRTLYDYSGTTQARVISYKLTLDAQASQVFTRQPDWLTSDRLNPHVIAETRRYSYTRFTLLSLVRCLQEYADAEFTRATAESVPRARELYLEALELLDLPEIKQHFNGCSDKIGELNWTIGEGADTIETDWIQDDIRRRLMTVEDYILLGSTVDRINGVLASGDPLPERLAEAQRIAAQAQMEAVAVPQPFSAILEANRNARRRALMALLAEPDVERQVVSLGEAIGTRSPDGQLLPSGNGSGRRALRGLEDASRGLDYERGYTPTLSFVFCIPPNPVIEAVRSHAESNLYKIRTCRNIAGLEMQLGPYDTPTISSVGLQSLGEDRLPTFRAPALQPLPYRYATLVERVKQLVELARQIEASLLASLQSRDQANYEILKARQDLGLARAEVRLKELQMAEATDGVPLAVLQRDRAQVQRDHYNRLLGEGTSLLEYASLALLGSAAVSYGSAAGGYFASAAAQGSNLTSFFDYWAKAGSYIAEGISAVAQAASTTASITSTLASYERRAQEWQLQAALAAQDVMIGQQQIVLAQDRVRLSAQEQAISALQARHSQEVLDFLDTKRFGSPALYDWMSNVLEQIYRFFLQQATSMAKLAEAQLAFERQELPPSYIQADYWRPPSQEQFAAPSDSSGQATDVRGLTGSARLLRDIYTLDQYAFQTNQRKLQLTETISLVRLDPFAFQRFRETGVLPFATSLSLFDQKFPGHYLRLIRRVRTSVIALIPPTQGIRATLATTGTSRVVIGGSTFQTVVVQRGPEKVALSSPVNATGLFELDPQSDLLVPFEGIGVDTTWEFRMPKAANLFDYRAVADVLITIDYTALDSDDYRRQVLEHMPRTFSGDRPYSFRLDFADQWWDLHNPDQTPTPLTVTFETFRTDFPLDLEGTMAVQEVVLYFVFAPGQEVDIDPVTLSFVPVVVPPIQPPPAPFPPTEATPIKSIISTRTGNWSDLRGKSVSGKWTLSFRPADGDPAKIQRAKKLFGQGAQTDKLLDILLVITYTGTLPVWPA